MKPHLPLFTLLALSCSAVPQEIAAGSSSSSSSGAPQGESEDATTAAPATTSTGIASSSDGADEHAEVSSGAGEGDPDTGDVPQGGVPEPTAPCPEFVDGWVTICPAGVDVCRDVVVANSGGTNGTGPLHVQWHGTYESPDGYLEWDYSTQQILAMLEEEHGMMVLPSAHPDAMSENDPYPWFIVCVGSDCQRKDDFILFDEIAACAVDQGLVDPKRIVTSGMSAGGIMTSHLIERVEWLAGAVSWSGGLSRFYRPSEPASDFAVISIHGGPTDTFDGYSFMTATVEQAHDLADRGSISVLCNHGNGHASTWITGVAPFFAAARHGELHPVGDYPFGSGGDWGFDMYCELVQPE
jgi:hypothetical protein